MQNLTFQKHERDKMYYQKALLQIPRTEWYLKKE